MEADGKIDWKRDLNVNNFHFKKFVWNLIWIRFDVSIETS